MSSNPNLTVPPNQTIGGPTATYGTVTINSGGIITIPQQTSVTITTAMVKPGTPGGPTSAAK